MALEIHCADALAYLAAWSGPPPAIVTSPPDAEEIEADLPQWREWFGRALGCCFAVGNPVVLYLTDRRRDGLLVSKAELAMDAARAADVALIWHKIALRRGPGKVDLRRPGYSHVLAFGRNLTSGQATPDVFDRGTMLYDNATGLVAARVMVEFALRCGAVTILDPFVGQGSITAAADALGASAVGVDIDADQCAKARKLKLVPSWPPSP